jgi:Bacterial membrane protein YfhO
MSVAQPVAGLVLGLAIAQAVAWCLARCLALRLPWRVQAAGLCLPIVVLLPLLHGGRLLAPTDAPILANLPDAPQVAGPDFAHGVFNDAILQLLPWEAEVRRSLAQGHLPFWSDALDGGSSPWVNPQAAVLSPIAMVGRLLPLEHFLLGTLAVKILLAFEGCWLLARVAGAGRLSSALGAGAFALGGPLMAWAVFPLSSVVAWSPWLALGVVRVVRRPWPRGIGATALIFAALLLSGHPEIAFAECLVAAGFGMIARRRRQRRRRLVPAVAAAGLAATLGACLAACALVPFLLVAGHSLRAAGAQSGGGPPAHAALAWFPPGEERLFLSPLNPWSFGRPFHEPYVGPANWPVAAGSYLGLVALAGAGFALGGARRRLAWSLLALALGVFLLAAGWAPCRWLVSLLPLGRAAALDRFLPAAALPLAVLAALGFDQMARPKGPAASLGLAAAAASLLVRHDVQIVALWLLIALAVLLASRRRLLGIALLGLASVLDLVSWDREVLPRGHRELFYPRTPLVAAVAGSVAQGGPWRAVAGGFGVYPSLLPMYGVADVRIDNPLAPAEQLAPLGEIFGFGPEGRRYKSGFRNIDHPFLDFLNVRTVILAEGAEVPPRFVLMRGEGPLRVWQNPSALPRWFLAVGAQVRGREDALSGIREMRDARRVVLVREEVGDWIAPERPWTPAAVRVLRMRRGDVKLVLPADGEKLLATSLPFPAGWTATTAGRVLRKVQVNTAYLGVIVPSGAAQVELSFVPPGFRIGAVLSLLGAAAVLLLLAVPCQRRGGMERSMR